MHLYFPDPDSMISPKNPIHVSEKTNQRAKEIFIHNDITTDYKALQKAIRVEGETIPSMFSAYIGLTHTMRFFGSIYDPDFGSVYETGIMITMKDLLEAKRKRYIEPYLEYLKIVLEERKVAKRAAREKKKAEKLAKKQSKTEEKIKRKKDQTL